jgi:hypothetical protein
MTTGSSTAARLAALALLVPVQAHAWGAPGHEIIAAIAEDRLTPAARAMVRDLVGAERLSDPDIATWADAHRDPRTKPWHYVNIPLGSRYDARRDCAKGCAVETISRAAEVLEGDASPRQRADALRWLVHVVGDLHQPLHAGDGWDRGGNLFLVRVERRRQPAAFHHVWDTDVVHPLLRGGLQSAVARVMGAITRDDAERWAAESDPAAWSNESSALALRIYRALGRRPQDTAIVQLSAVYVPAQGALASEQLAKAGVRLAALLNRIAERRVRAG